MGRSDGLTVEGHAGDFDGSARTPRQRAVGLRRRSVRSTAPTGGGAAGCGASPAAWRSHSTSCPSLKRLLGHLAPERMILILVVLLAVTGIVMNVIGPKILGMATDVIFTGVIGKNLPAGATKEQVVAHLRAQGNNTFADMVERLDVIPGQGIDFTLLGELLLLALGLYLVCVTVPVAAGIPAERGGAALDLHPAQPGRGQDQPAAAELLRQADSRRSC